MHWDSAGTERYVKNASVWLIGIDNRSVTPLFVTLLTSSLPPTSVANLQTIYVHKPRTHLPKIELRATHRSWAGCRRRPRSRSPCGSSSMERGTPMTRRLVILWRRPTRLKREERREKEGEREKEDRGEVNCFMLGLAIEPIYRC